MTSLNIKFLYGGMYVSASGYDILMGVKVPPFPSPSSTSSNSITYTSTPGGGVGLVGVANPRPDLKATVFGLDIIKPESPLNAFIRPILPDSTKPLDYTYISGPGGGVGLVGSTITPDLTASIFMTPLPVFYERVLPAFIQPVQSSSTQPLNYIYVTGGPSGGIGLVASTATPDLTATIAPSLFFHDDTDLSGYIFATTSSGNALEASYRSADIGEATLSGFIDGFDEEFLEGYYRATFSGELGGLIGQLEAVEPLDLIAQLTGVTGLDLFANLEPIVPFPLLATVTGIPFQNLSAYLSGFDYSNLYTTLTGTNISPELFASVSGIAPGSGTLTSNLHGYRGIEQSTQLRATLIFREELTITGSIEGFEPSSLSGTYEPVPPADLPAEILAKASGIPLEATISGILADGSLLAEITPQGGTRGLTGYLTPSTATELTLTAIAEGIATAQLIAEYGNVPQQLLSASLTATGINNLGLSADILPTQTIILSGSYTVAPSQGLEAQIEAIEYAALNATITPKVFYVDSSIPINTFPFKDLKAIINATGCAASSFYQDLGVYIKGVDSLALEASVVGIAGQYAITEDYVSILKRNKVISEDWVFLIAEQSIISESIIPLVITTSPFTDLGASIVGIQPASDLLGSISPIYYSGVRSDNSILGEWVNPSSGQRKTVKIFFRGNSSEFYYSTDADKSFTSSPKNFLEVIVETYEKVDETETTLLTQKQGTKRCIVDNLQDFSSIDDAIRYGIMCALSEINQELRAFIIAKGGHNSLQAEITPVDDDYLKDLDARYVTVTNQPDLYATVTGTGGTLGLQGYIVPMIAANTSSNIIDTLGTRYVPKLVTHGTGQVSVVLTRVVSTDSINISSVPDLSSEIFGVSLDDLGATISGSP